MIRMVPDAFALVLSGLDQSVLEGVPAEFEALGPELLEVCQLTSEREITETR